MFYVRPIAREDLPALLALSERTGSGLTTLPANVDRLAQRIERSLASFAGAAAKADACYVFVLADDGTGSVVGISAIERPWACPNPGTTTTSGRRCMPRASWAFTPRRRRFF